MSYPTPEERRAIQDRLLEAEKVGNLLHSMVKEYPDKQIGKLIRDAIGRRSLPKMTDADLHKALMEHWKKLG